MILEKAVLKIYPDAIVHKDFLIVADSETGEQSFAYWNEDKYPVPTQEELDIAWIEAVREMKDEELNTLCNQSILHGFDHIINDVSYHFSFDTEAQLNFQGIERLFSNGMITSVRWTVTNNETGLKERITLTKTDMDTISLLILRHKDDNVSKYRDDLGVQLSNAKTIDEINQINWN